MEKLFYSLEIFCLLLVRRKIVACIGGNRAVINVAYILGNDVGHGEGKSRLISEEMTWDIAKENRGSFVGLLFIGYS